MEQLLYQVGRSTFQVGLGDLSTAVAEALVSSDDNYLSMGGGVSMALSCAAGRAVTEHARKLLPLHHGDVAVTTAGKLPAKYIFHAVTIDLDSYSSPGEAVVGKATRRALELADQLAVRTIAFPALGTGVGRLPFPRNASVMVQAIADHLAGDTRIEDVSLYLLTHSHLHEEDPSIFYLRAASLAAAAGQTKSVYRAAKALDDALQAANRPDLSASVQQVLNGLRTAGEALAESPANTKEVDRIQRDSNVLDISAAAVKMTDRDVWENRQIGLSALRTRLAGLTTQLNVHYGSLNKLEIEKARYGGVGVPLILENQITTIQDEIRQVEDRMGETRAKLAVVSGER
jgi:O-acetyl-ADP-ribose deacetylase (regulator of RNase III)